MLPTAITMRFPFSPIRISTDWRNYYFFLFFGAIKIKKNHTKIQRRRVQNCTSHDIFVYFFWLWFAFSFIFLCVYIYIYVCVCVCVCVCVYVCVLV